MSMQHKCDLKSQVWFQIKIAQSKVQLSLYYYIHFEIKKNPVTQIWDVSVCANILLLQCWAGFYKIEKSDWLLSFSKAVSLAEKKTWLKGKQWCDFLINRIDESQWHGKDHHWFQIRCK